MHKKQMEEMVFKKKKKERQINGCKKWKQIKYKNEKNEFKEETKDGEKKNGQKIDKEK